MKRLLFALAMMGTLSTTMVHAETQAAYAGFRTGIPKAPRHAAFFRDAPHCGLVPHTRIFFVDGKHFEHDAFSYESVWFVYCGGYWYRSRGYRGPFAAIEVHDVPRPILEVSPKHWKHHPLGLVAGSTPKSEDEAQVKARDTHRKDTAKKPVKDKAVAAKHGKAEDRARTESMQKRAANVTVTKDRESKHDVGADKKKQSDRDKKDKKAKAEKREKDALAKNDRSKKSGSNELGKKPRGRNEHDASRDVVLARNQAGRH